MIAAGALDGDDASVDKLAERLGVGARQLRRLFQQHLGASPQTVAQTRRVLFAKRLIHETRLPMAEIALASGFGSVRRFNETFQELYRRPPSALRRRGVVALPEGTVAGSGVTVRVRYRAPYDWAAMLAHLRARAVDGVEHIDGEVYRRTVCEDGETGTVAVAHRARQAEPGGDRALSQRARAAGDHRARAPPLRRQRRRHRDRRAPGARSAAGAAGQRASRPARARRLGRLRDRGARDPRPASDGRGGAAARGRARAGVRPAGRDSARRRCAPESLLSQRRRRRERVARGAGRGAGPGGAPARVAGHRAGGGRRSDAVPAARARSTRPRPGCRRCPESASGRRTTSRCAPAAIPTRSPRPTSGSCARGIASAPRQPREGAQPPQRNRRNVGEDHSQTRTQPRCPNGRRAGGPGAATPPSISGPQRPRGPPKEAPHD